MTTTTLRSRISGAAVCRFLGGRVVPCLNLNRPTLCCYCRCSCCRRRRGRRRGGWGPATRRQSATAHFAPLPPPLPGRPGQPRRRVGGPPRPSWPRNYAASASSSRQLQYPALSLAALQHRVVPIAAAPTASEIRFSFAYASSIRVRTFATYASKLVGRTRTSLEN